MSGVLRDTGQMQRNGTEPSLSFIPGPVNLTAAFSPFPIPPAPPDVQPLPSPGASLPFVFDFTGPVLGPPYGNHVSEL